MTGYALERTLPHNIDAEKAILGAVLVNNAHWLQMAGRLEAEDFYLEAHRHIFRVMVGLIESQQVADLVTLQSQLVTERRLEAAGGVQYLIGLMDGIPHLVNVDHYVELVKGKSALRALIQVSNRIMAEAFEAVDAPGEIVDRAEQAILALATKDERRGLVPVRSLELGVTQLIEKLYTDRQLITGVATGFRDLDRMTSGFQKGDLVILAARPGVGKTAWCLNVAAHVSLHSGLPVAMFSLEMSKEQLMLRMLAADARVDAHKMRTGYIGKDDFRKLIDALGRISQAPMYIDDSSQLTVTELRGKARRLAAEMDGLGLIIVDYIQLMSAKAENRNQEISQISRGLKQVAKELGVPVLALAQLSRAPEQRTGDHRPQLSDLRESGSLEQDADTVMFIFREEMYGPTEENMGLAELIVSKQRNGPVGTSKMAFLKEYTRFETLLDLA